MGRTKTFVRRTSFSRGIRHKKAPRAIKRGMGVDIYNPTAALADEDRIGRAIWECLKSGDPEGVIEVIQVHLEAAHKVDHLNLRSKNPTIKTLAKCVQACA